MTNNILPPGPGEELEEDDSESCKLIDLVGLSRILQNLAGFELIIVGYRISSKPSCHFPLNNVGIIEFYRIHQTLTDLGIRCRVSGKKS